MCTQGKTVVAREQLVKYANYVSRVLYTVCEQICYDLERNRIWQKDFYQIWCFTNWYIVQIWYFSQIQQKSVYQIWYFNRKVPNIQQKSVYQIWYFNRKEPNIQQKSVYQIWYFNRQKPNLVLQKGRFLPNLVLQKGTRLGRKSSGATQK